MQERCNGDAAPSLRQHANFQPRIVAYLCENGAHVFYEVSNPARRKLPINFIGLPVASVSQVQKAEVLKAFLSGAEGVLVLGCEACRSQRDQQQTTALFSEILQALMRLGIDQRRLRLEWISATEEERFLRVVNEMAETVRHMDPLQPASGFSSDISYCG